MGHYNLGLIYLRRQDPSLARQSLKKAGELNPLHFGAHYQLGKLYRDAGLLDQALPCFLQARRLHPDKAFIHRYLGECWVKKGDWDKALSSAFKSAVRVNPRDAYSLHQLGVLNLLRESNLPIALSFCRYSVELEKGNPHFQVLAGTGSLSEPPIRRRSKRTGNCLGIGGTNRSALFFSGSISGKTRSNRTSPPLVGKSFVL